MNDIAKKLKAYIEAHPFQAGKGNWPQVFAPAASFSKK